MTEELARKIAELPDSPGCYIMKHEGEVIYVGKAKNLKNRVRQYFHAAGHTAKVQAMVEKIDDFDLVLVDGELEALILECNLIKLHRPWYNILLKDDKHYPFLRLDLSEPFPRLTLVRQTAKDGAKYYGPYIGATAVREVMDVVRANFPLRTCTHKLPAERPMRPCVHYEIGQCLAPCAGLVSPEMYKQALSQVMDFLSGHYDSVLRGLREQMRQAALNLQYERAATLRDRIRAVEDVMQKQKAIVADGGDQDVLAALSEGDDAYVQQVMIRAGKMIGSETHLLERAGDEPLSEVLCSFMLQYYGDAAAPPREILVSESPAESDTLAALLAERRGAKVALICPKRGEKRQLVELALKNARDAAEKREARLRGSYERTGGALKILQEVLGLPEPPNRIEGYDISNTQGAQSVGSMVVMKQGAASRRDYRIFKIRTVEGANDFASIHEVISRRLTHGLREREERLRAGEDPATGKFSELPDLILIDGGRGQLNAALDAMNEVGVRIPIFGLAKRVEEMILPGESESILLDRHSPALHLLQRLRDEAHRFGITRHRSLRAAASLKSRLDGIPGVGPVRKKALLTRFPTIESILNATVEELCEAEGVSVVTAESIYRHLHESDTEKQESEGSSCTTEKSTS